MRPWFTFVLPAMGIVAAWGWGESCSSPHPGSSEVLRAAFLSTNAMAARPAAFSQTQIDQALTAVSRSTTYEQMPPILRFTERRIGIDKLQISFVRLRAKGAEEQLLACLLKQVLESGVQNFPSPFTDAVVATALSLKYGDKSQWSEDKHSLRVMYEGIVLPPNIVAIQLLGNFPEKIAVPALKKILGRPAGSPNAKTNLLEAEILRTADAALRRVQSESPYSDEAVDKAMESLKSEDATERVAAISHLAIYLDNSSGRPAEISYIAGAFSRQSELLVKILEDFLDSENRHEVVVASYLLARMIPHPTEELVHATVFNYKGSRDGGFEFNDRLDTHMVRSTYRLLGRLYVYHGETRAWDLLIRDLAEKRFRNSDALLKSINMNYLLNVVDADERLPDAAGRAALASFIRMAIIDYPSLVEQAISALSKSALNETEFSEILRALTRLESQDGKLLKKKDPLWYGNIHKRLKELLKKYNNSTTSKLLSYSA